MNESVLPQFCARGRSAGPARWVALFAGVLLACLSPARGADAVFSGPQPGERTTGFKVIAIGGDSDAKERDPIAENTGAATALVFVHQMERSLVPLLRVIDQYGVERKDRLKTEVVFLVPDRISGEPRVRAANGSLKLSARVGISGEGTEGPGNYGLNKDCLMTIVAAKENRVQSNFALVQPGLADAPKVIAALAKLCGDENPPTAEALLAKTPGGGGMARGREGMEPRRPGANANTNTNASAPKENFPGAPPTDDLLLGLLRRFIRPTNDDATVDRVLTEVRERIRGNADLTKQAIDGWTRVLHFGDRYGTAYARQTGHKFLEELRAAEVPK